MQMKVKEQLRAIRSLDFEINALIRVMESERTRAERRTTVFSPEEKGDMSPDSRERVYVRLIDLSRQLDEKIDALVDKKTEMFRLIQGLSTAEHRMVLIERYLNRASWKEIAEFVGCGERQVYNLHGDALAGLESLCSKLQ